MTDRMKETLLRVLSAVVALPVYFFAIYTDSLLALPVLVVSSIISTICLIEFYLIAERSENEKALIMPGVLMSLAVNIVMYLFAYGKVMGLSRYIGNFDARLILGVVVVFMAAMLLYNLFKRPLKGTIYSLAVTVFGLIFIVFSFSHIILMKSLSNGFYYILMLNLVIMANDTAAYFGGVLFGKHKTGFEVSPNKSWEGYSSGLLFTIIVMILINQAYASFLGIHFFSFIEAGILGIFISIFANMGDLLESAIKRDGDIKDSGTIIPGHGGMWDVFDAIIFTLPLFYYYLVLKGVN